MKYFSPNILDGSVTTAKLADLAVTTAKLANASVDQTKLFTLKGTQAGTIPSDASVLIAMNPYTFFMDAEVVDGLIMRYGPAVVATPAANADAPQFNIKNLVSVAKLYDVEWRHVEV